MAASLNGHLKVVKLILAHPDVDVNMQNEVSCPCSRFFVYIIFYKNFFCMYV